MGSEGGECLKLQNLLGAEVCKVPVTGGRRPSLRQEKRKEPLLHIVTFPV